jgi:hypothetical protein
MESIAIIIALIVPIGVAIWTVRSSAKDTAKQIAALEESTTKQVESIKALSKQMIEASIKQVELEIEKNLFLAKQAKQEWEEIDKINNGGLSNIVEWKNEMMKRFQEGKPERDYHLYSKFAKELNVIKKCLEANKTKLN